MKPNVRETILSMFEASGQAPLKCRLNKEASLHDAKFNTNPPRTKGIEGYGTGKVKVGDPVTVYGEALDPDLDIREFTTSLVTEVLDEDFMAGEWCAGAGGTEIIKFRTLNSIYVLQVEKEH